MSDDAPADAATFAPALAAARPTSPELGRRLRMRAVIAAVVGVERPRPQLDGYELERQVGAGGMGVVYLGRALATGRPVAIKMIEAASGIERARFAREAAVLRALECPGVCGYLDSGTGPGGQPYLVMEWIDGEDLATRLRRGPLDVTAALHLGLALARTLTAVHAAGVVHRDLKPSNVMLAGTRLDDARVIDFGVARGGAAGARLTATGAVIGTPSYMAPEQLRGEADARTDVYGLAATMFEALTGRPVFVGGHPGAIMLAVLVEAPPSLSALRPEIPGAVDALIGRMLAKDPGDRPVDMAAVVAELAQIVSSRRGGAVLSRAERVPAPATQAPPTDPGGVLGRARPLAQLLGVLAEVADEDVAALVAISGEAGVGKSALLDAAAAALPAWRCLRARARRDEQGSPFAVVRALAMAAADGTVTLTDPAVADRAALLFDALRMPPGEDPVVQGDRVVLAWLDHLEALSAAGPLALFIDDVDRADLSSLRLLERALLHLAARPFALVVTQAAARPVALGDGLDPSRVVALRLGPLGPRASARLVRRWAPGCDAADAARVVGAAAGNPMHLRELCRDLGRVAPGDAPRSVAELLWARLVELPPDVRRALRAASIVGREAWLPAVALLLGAPAGDALVARHCEALIAAGYLRATPSRLFGQAQLEFTSELAYLAAYELTDAAERRAGHRAVADWLAQHAPQAELLRARHLDGAGARDEAARHHLAAARSALAGGDTALFEASLARAAAADAPPEVRGESLILRGQAAFWRGALRDALVRSGEAMAAVAVGSAAWFGAASLAITSAGQLGDHPQMLAIAEQVAATPPQADEPVAAERRVIAACRAVSQLGPERAAKPAVRAIIDAAVPAALGPEGRAWLARANSQGWTSGFDLAIDGIVAAHRAHVEQGDLRSAALMGIYLCSYYVWTGGWERARQVIDDALRVVRRLEVGYLELWGGYAEAKLLVEVAPFEVARGALDRIVAGAAESPRIRAGAQIYAAIAASRAGQHDLAVAYGAAARATHDAPAVALASAAAEARGWLGLGEVERARALAPALAAHATAPFLPEFDELVRLAWAEVAAATDATVGARAIASAAAAVACRAATLADPLRRNEYLARPHLLAQIAARAARASAPPP